MALFDNLMQCKSQCRHLLRQYFMTKYLERTATCALQRPLVGQRNYCAPSSKTAPKASEDWNRQKEIFLNKSLGMSIAYSRMKSYATVEKISLQILQEAMEVLESEEIQKQDIHNNLKVLAIAPGELRQRTHCLKEIGFGVDAPEIIKYKFLMRMSTEILHQHGVLPRTVNPFENIVKNLECSPQLQNEIYTACTDSYQLPLGILREKIIKCIVAHYLGSTLDNTGTLQHLISKQSASDVHKIILIYKELGLFSKLAQRNVMSILRKYPDDIIQIMKIAEQYQLDLKYIVSRQTAILKKKPSILALTCRTLFDYGISPAQIMQNPQIFVYDLNYISDALEEMSKWPEFPLLKLQKSFVKLITLFNRANLHKAYMKKAGYYHCNLNMLIENRHVFKIRLYRGKNINMSKDIVSYISTILDVPDSDVIAGLCNHPWFQDGSANNVKEVLTFLIHSGFTKTQILNGIALVLYPKGKVVKAYEALPNLDIVKPYSDWKENVNLLHLVLYFVEKGEHSFLKPEPDTDSNNLRETGS